MTNDTTLLFGLEGVDVISVDLDEHANPVIALVTAAAHARCCPGCGVVSQHPHSWVRTRPRDLPVAGRYTSLTWTKRRWRCRNPECERLTFTESVPQIPPGHRITARARTALGAAIADQGRSVLQAAREFQVSCPIAHGAFTQAANAVLPATTPPVENLGIDETRRGKAKYRLVHDEQGDSWEVVKDRWHIGYMTSRNPPYDKEGAAQQPLRARGTRRHRGEMRRPVTQPQGINRASRGDDQPPATPESMRSKP